MAQDSPPINSSPRIKPGPDHPERAAPCKTNERQTVNHLPEDAQNSADPGAWK